MWNPRGHNSEMSRKLTHVRIFPLLTTRYMTIAVSHLESTCLPQLWDRPWVLTEISPSSSSCSRPCSHHCWRQSHRTWRHITPLALWAGDVNMRSMRLLLWFPSDNKGSSSNKLADNYNLNNGHQGRKMPWWPCKGQKNTYPTFPFIS